MTRLSWRFAVGLCLCAGLFAGSRFAKPAKADDIAERAKKLHFSSMVLDTHDDTTQRFFSKDFDLGKRNPDGHVDIPRMREGGMNAIFFSIWIDGRIMGPPAVQKALDQIDAVHENVLKYSKDMVFCRTAEEVRRAHAQGKIAALIGVEGGHMIGNDIRVLRMFGDLGVRYMTLTHFYNDEWADSSTDKPAHNGLTDFGKEIVREMNRQGIMVDISHVSDKTFYDALEVSKAPLIASHSSCRALCNHPRDMSDDMIKALAAKGGVIQINYERSFIDQAYKDAYDKASGGVVETIGKITKECGDDSDCTNRKLADLQKQMEASGALPRVSWEKIIDHIDHAVKLVGPDHVGLGSDFDGATMPDGMEDCSKLPKITEALMRKGYKDDDIRKILSGNLLRVMEENERVSRELQAQYLLLFHGEMRVEMPRTLLKTALCVATGGFLVAGVKSGDISARAKKLHFSSIVVDTHDDTTQRFLEGKFDIGARHDDGSIDVPRMREGGLGAIFFSIWIPSKITGAEAVNRALAQIEAVREQVRAHPKELALATTAAEVRAAHKEGKIAALMGVEGGHMINSDLDELRKFAGLGVRYMTLTHSGNDEWADSSTDKPTHNGLTDFGKDVVREMNRLGMMVDISHVSDKTFYDALEISKAPMIASHSSCRAICDAPRNMTDQMMKDLVAKGGVVQVNYHVGFLSQAFRSAERANPEINKAIGEEVQKRCGDNEACQLLEGDRLTREYVEKGKLPRVHWTKIIEHIDHAVKVAGIDHVGLGSDFDGANMPYGMENASKLPKITEALLKKGYSEGDVKKILGENTLRLMDEVERVSRELPKQGRK